MATLTIRGLDDHTKAQLRLRAAHNQRSMEEEARHMLRQALATSESPSPSLAAAIRRRFAPLGGVKLTLPTREVIRQPPKFTK
jgi:antitoxin FitA